MARKPEFINLFLLVGALSGGCDPRDVLEGYSEVVLSGRYPGANYGSWLAPLHLSRGPGIAITAPGDGTYGLPGVAFIQVLDQLPPLEGPRPRHGFTGLSLDATFAYGCDLDGDGLDELLLGTGEGQLAVFSGKEDPDQSEDLAAREPLQLLGTMTPEKVFSPAFGHALVCIGTAGEPKVLLIGDPDCSVEGVEGVGCVLIVPPELRGSARLLELGAVAPRIHGPRDGRGFGASLALAGEEENAILLIGAPEGGAGRGAVHVVSVASLSPDGHTWHGGGVEALERQGLRGDPSDRAFGTRIVSLENLTLDDESGDLIAISSPGEAESLGRVALHRLLSNGNLEVRARTVILGESPGDGFGTTLTVTTAIREGRLQGQGNPPTLLIGAPDSSLFVPGGGLVYVLPSDLPIDRHPVPAVNGGRLLVGRAELGTSGAPTARRFGSGLACGAAWIAVGAPGARTALGAATGAVHLFFPSVQ